MWTTSPDAYQRGFSVPAAIFIVVILAALGAFMVTVGSGQQLGHAQDIAGSRVLQAARTGIEWGIYQIVNTPADATTGPFHLNCKSDTSPAVIMPALTEMTGVTVRVECVHFADPEGASTIHSYRLKATACNATPCPNTAAPWSPLYVEREIVTSISLQE